MSTKTPSPTADRPRAVSIAGNITVTLSATVVVLMVVAMAQLNTAQSHEALQGVLDDLARAGQTVSIDTVRTWVRIAICVLAVLSSTSLVLGIFVLLRHRAARVALTALGGLVLVVLPFMWAVAGPVGWLGGIAIAVSLVLLWTPSARAWFDRDNQPAGPPAGAAPQPPRPDEPPTQPSASSRPPWFPPSGGPTPRPPQAPRPPSSAWPPPSGWGPAPPPPLPPGVPPPLAPEPGHPAGPRPGPPPEAAQPEAGQPPADDEGGAPTGR